VRGKTEGDLERTQTEKCDEFFQTKRKKMGSTKSKEVEIGADSVTVPPWATNYNGKTSLVFFDMEADGRPLGRIEMCLMTDIVPKT
jgi:hypothetical protein